MNKGLILSIVATIAIIGLFIWLNGDKDPTELTYFKNTDVACLTNGHTGIAEHIHPELKITVDGENEVIPGNIGIEGGCMSEIHTHDTTGVIHAESFTPGRIAEFTLAKFYEVWGVSPERDGYNLEIIQDGEIKNSVEEVDIIDGSQIELKYTSA